MFFLPSLPSSKFSVDLHCWLKVSFTWFTPLLQKKMHHCRHKDPIIAFTLSLQSQVSFNVTILIFASPVVVPLISYCPYHTIVKAKPISSLSSNRKLIMKQRLHPWLCTSIDLPSPTVVLLQALATRLFCSRPSSSTSMISLKLSKPLLATTTLLALSKTIEERVLHKFIVIVLHHHEIASSSNHHRPSSHRIVVS